MADIELIAGQYNDTLTFTVTSYAPLQANSVTVMNLSGATVTLVTQDGIRRLMTVTSVASGAVAYTTSAEEFRTPCVHKAYVEILFGSARRAYSSSFSVQVKETIERF